MKNLFYLAADGRRQRLDSILYRLPTRHPIYSMPFGQSENLIYSPVRAEYLMGGKIIIEVLIKPANDGERQNENEKKHN
ncbi:MAG: hypothetical protein NTX75_09050 [Proteobacteria bacterium]|nr:hypothetical protein [Pseudomonadota bacterium]